MVVPSGANLSRNRTLKVLMVFLRLSQSAKILGPEYMNVRYVGYFSGVIQRGPSFYFL